MNLNYLLFLVGYFLLLHVYFSNAKSDGKKERNKKREKKRKEKNIPEPPPKKKEPKILSFPDEPSNVIEITKNHTNVTKENPVGRYLIFFYYKITEHAVQMNTLFNKISLIKGQGFNDFKFYRVNGRKRSKFVEQNGFYADNNYIVLKCNDFGMRYLYEGSVESEEELINFIHNIIKIKIQEIKSLNEFDKKKKSGGHLLLVGDPKKFSNPFNTISKFSRKYFRHIYWTNNTFFYDKFKIKHGEMDAIAYFTINGTLNEGERMNFSPDEMNKNKILKISEIYSRKPYALLDYAKLERILNNKLKAVVLIENENMDKDKKQKLDVIFEELASKYREEYWFLRTTEDNHISDIFFESLHIDIEDHNEDGKFVSPLPCVAIIDNVKSNHHDLDIFLMPKEAELTLTDIASFIKYHKAGKLKRIITSEVNDDPDQFYIENNNVTRLYKVIGTTLDELIFNNYGKDVVLLICSHSKMCKKYRKRYERVAEKMVNSSNLYFGHIDYAHNEILHVTFKTVPCIIMVPDVGKNKAKNYVTMEGDYGTMKIIEFITKNALAATIAPIEPSTTDKQIQKEKPTKFFKTASDEQMNTYELDSDGAPIGNGFIKAANRYFFHYTEIKKKDDEYNDLNYLYQDPKDYDGEAHEGPIFANDPHNHDEL